MNRKFLVIAVAFMAVAVLATPVMAEPTAGLKVPATLTTVPIDEVDPEWWITNGHILQGRGGQETHLLILNIGGTVHISVDTSVFDEMLNYKTRMLNRRYTTLDSGLDNGFAGNIEIKIYNWKTPDMYYTAHCVLQGFGNFEGQTLMLSYEGPLVVPMVWTGYCLKG